MHSQMSTLRTPAVASRAGDRREASPLRTEAANRSTNASTRVGSRAAARSITPRVAWG